MKTFLFAAAALSALALAACGGGGGGGVSPTPGPTCGPIGIASQLIYPAPGATNAPDAPPQIVIAVSSPLPINSYNLAIFNASTGSGTTTANYLAQIQASQLPAGSGTTTISNPTYEAVNLVNPLTANFASGTTLQTAINDPSSNCTPQNVPGTFTIQ